MSRKGTRIGVALAIAAGLATAAGGALAQGAMVQAVKDRQAHFKQQGRAFKGILDELKKEAPDKTLIATNAATLKGLAAQLPTWFPKGSGPETRVKMEAKPEIWSDPAGFAEVAKRFQAETVKFDQIAASGDIAAVKGEVRAVGGACKACHDKYRVQDKD